MVLGIPAHIVPSKPRQQQTDVGEPVDRVQDVVGFQLKLPKRTHALIIVLVAYPSVFGPHCFLSHLDSFQHLFDRGHTQSVPYL